jgi:uncharacterized membrane protein YbhN (UPF0104 family)
MSTLTSDAGKQVQGRASLWKSDALRGALVGLIPLSLLVIMIIIALTLGILIREAFTAAGFFTQQQATLITLIIALALAVVVYVVAIWRTLRRVAVWQKDAAGWRKARAALWTLGITALIVLMPVILALVLPQHPAP